MKVPEDEGQTQPTRSAPRPRPRTRRRRLVPPWLLPVAVGLAILVAGYAVFWFAYVRPMDERIATAEAYYLKGDYTRANDALQQVLAGNPNRVDALLVLARVKGATGDSSAGLALYARVIERWPNDATAHYEMASLERLVGSTAAAVPHFEAAVRLEPGNRAYLEDLVKAYVATGKVRAAVTLLLERAQDTRRAVSERADLYVLTASVLLGSGENTEARDALGKALKLVPKHPSATRMLSQFK